MTDTNKIIDSVNALTPSSEDERFILQIPDASEQYTDILKAPTEVDVTIDIRIDNPPEIQTLGGMVVSETTQPFNKTDVDELTSKSETGLGIQTIMIIGLIFIFVMVLVL